MAVDTALMARVFGWFFLVGGVLALVTVALPHPDDVYELGVVIPALVAIGGAVVFFAGFDRLPLWYFHAALDAAIVQVAIAIYSGGPVLGFAYSTMYFWSAITAFSLFTRRQAIGHTLFIGVALAVVLALRDDYMASAVQWLMIMSAVLVAGLMIAVLRNRLEMLLAGVGHAARTDVLTGLTNRRGFDERFEIELERARRTGRPLGVVAVDLDHFKQVNDRFGHQVGDQALQMMADALRRSTRRVDLVARLGGEEFAIVAPDTAGALAYTLAERVRAEVERTFSGWYTNLTASCGVAIFPGDGERPDQLVYAADQALYAAKESGRNMTVVNAPRLAEAPPGPAVCSWN